jgi:hypothetical protein
VLEGEFPALDGCLLDFRFRDDGVDVEAIGSAGTSLAGVLDAGVLDDELGTDVVPAASAALRAAIALSIACSVDGEEDENLAAFASGRSYRRLFFGVLLRSEIRAIPDHFKALGHQYSKKNYTKNVIYLRSKLGGNNIFFYGLQENKVFVGSGQGWTRIVERGNSPM